MFRREYRIDILLINTNSYDVLSQPLTELPYITKLLAFYYVDKSIQILLEGFLDYHNWLCNKEECASKKKVKIIPMNMILLFEYYIDSKNNKIF